MKGTKFERAKMSIDPASTKMDAIIAADAAEHLKIVGVCARFRLVMGPIADEQLIVAPHFWVTVTICDIFGLCYICIPGHSMETRNRKVIDVKCYILVFLCPTIKMVNLQVFENKSAVGVIDCVNRLGCQVGIPSHILVDKDSGIMKALDEAEVDLKDLQLLVYKENGIKFRTCPVSEHNFHGAVVRKVRAVQECLEKSEISNDLNNLPLGFSYGRDADNSRDGR